MHDKHNSKSRKEHIDTFILIPHLNWLLVDRKPLTPAFKVDIPSYLPGFVDLLNEVLVNM